MTLIRGQPTERVYGPVPSRRFGLSLGVDLVPHKVCCYDCVYCQVGKTTAKTVRRRDFYPLDAILREVGAALDDRPRPDVITLAGSGEPTLYRSLGSLIREIRSLTSLPVVLLTGGGTLAFDDVAADAVTVDVLAPSLDAGDPEQFAAINRPYRGITFSRMAEGLARALNGFHGSVRLEVMLIPELNDDQASLERIAALVGVMRVSAIDLNTPVRPSHAPGVGVASMEALRRAVAVFGPQSRVIGQFSGPLMPTQAAPKDLETMMVETLARRPCTLQDLVAALSCDPGRLHTTLDGLLAAGVVEERRSRDEVYFWAPMGSAEESSVIAGPQ